MAAHPEATEMTRTRTIPIDFRAIAEETGIKRGTLVKHPALGWTVRNDGDALDIAVINPPPLEGKETTRTVEDGCWVFWKE